MEGGERKSMTMKKAGTILGGFGSGSVLAFYLYILCQNWLLSSQGRLQEIIKVEQISLDMASIYFFSIILPAGIVCLFLAPIFIVRNRKTGIKLSFLLMFIVAVAEGTIVTAASGKISLIYTIVVWIFSVYCCFLILEGIHAICCQVGNVLKFSTK
ncbi:hypothetical protein B5E53_08695 [Eubacterium sp. An11]|nr:hypothetical protein B5E53_08695 [Eubacterium sp. An11]